MDQMPADQPSKDPSDGSGQEIVPEQELIDVLAEATKLVGELARQLDGEQLPPPMDDAPSPEPKSSKLEDQLDDLDVLLAATSNELGEAPTPSSESPGPESESSVEDAEPPVPDFMDEFTHPEEASDDVAQSSQVPTDTPQLEPKPGVVGTGIVGVATAEQSSPPVVTQDESVAETSSRRGVDLRERFARLAGLFASAAQGLLTLLIPAAERVVSLLEKGDRPLAKLKAPIRRVIGWLAIATLGTSAFVFFWSLI